MEEFDDVARARASDNQFVKALNAGREILQCAGPAESIRLWQPLIRRAFGTLKQ